MVTVVAANSRSPPLEPFPSSSLPLSLLPLWSSWEPWDPFVFSRPREESRHALALLTFEVCPSHPREEGTSLISAIGPSSPPPPPAHRTLGDGQCERIAPVRVPLPCRGRGGRAGESSSCRPSSTPPSSRCRRSRSLSRSSSLAKSGWKEGGKFVNRINGKLLKHPRELEGPRTRDDGGGVGVGQDLILVRWRATNPNDFIIPL